MDEDLAIIDSKTRLEKFKNFFLNNRKKIILILSILFFLIIIFFGYEEYKKKNKISISEIYNSTVINNSPKNKEKTTKALIEIIYKEDQTYSPLSLYYIIDNNLITDKKIVNDLFDIIIKKTPLDKEIRNLIIYKKALYNSDDINENDLIEMLNPLINSKSVWKSHALYLIAEYFYDKKEKQKSKEFYNSILQLENANSNIRAEAQKRLNRDLSD